VSLRVWRSRPKYANS